MATAGRDPGLASPSSSATIAPMKTKRRAWVVAGVVVLLAVLCGALVASGIWQDYVYEDMKQAAWCVYPDGFSGRGELSYSRKRFSFVPGPDFLIAPQVCWGCKARSHAQP